MNQRGRISGRHFDLMRRLVNGDADLPESPELTALVRWGYAVRDGTKYAASNAGRLAFETWSNMDVIR